MSRKYRLPGIVQSVPARVAARLFANYTEINGCWISNYSTGSHGYSQIGWHQGGTRVMALGHRAAWMATHGSIGEGMTVDHVCRVRRCINPAHLRLLPNVVNASDNGLSRKTHCIRGHEFTPENTYRSPSKPHHRKCRQCASLYKRAA